jgi:hypothetical protein
MITYNEQDNDLFSDTIITDTDYELSDGDELSTIDMSIGNTRKIAIHHYLVRHKIEERLERLRLRRLLEEF